MNSINPHFLQFAMVKEAIASQRRGVLEYNNVVLQLVSEWIFSTKNGVRANPGWICLEELDTPLKQHHRTVGWLSRKLLYFSDYVIRDTSNREDIVPSAQSSWSKNNGSTWDIWAKSQKGRCGRIKNKIRTLVSLWLKGWRMFLKIWSNRWVISGRMWIQ